jgi:hypothetical protein
MPSHDSNHDGHEPQPVDTSHGYEASDVKPAGIIVFLVAMAIFVVAAAVIAYGLGKVYNAYFKKVDGPPSKWAKSVDVRDLGTNMPTSPQLEKKLAEMTQNFPTPQVQTDDGSQDVADLHRREDLLLEHYSWADQQQGKVRIPIERAMEIVAQGNTIQVLPPKQLAEPMTGEKNPVVTAPLTTGFARTSFEQAQAAKGSN